MHISSYDDVKNLDGDEVAAELFSSMNREVVEEANIPMEFILDTRMIGVVG